LKKNTKKHQNLRKTRYYANKNCAKLNITLNLTLLANLKHTKLRYCPEEMPGGNARRKCPEEMLGGKMTQVNSDSGKKLIQAKN